MAKATVKDILIELRALGFTIAMTSEHTGLSKVRLYHALNKRPSRFDTQEVKKLEIYRAKVQDLINTMSKLTREEQ